MSSRILIDPQNSTQPLPPHPDHLTLPAPLSIGQPANPTIGIEEIRELIRWAHRKPFEKDSQQILILQAQHLTEEAQNALLKILEEPPERTKITLAVSHVDHLLPTVRSRCSIVHHRTTNTNIKDPISNVALPSSIQDAFGNAEKLAKLDRREIIEKLDRLILYLRADSSREEDLALRSLGIGGLTKHWKSIQTIRSAQEQVRSNVNLKLSLENLFLRLTQLI